MFCQHFRDVTVSSLHFVVTHEMSSLLVTIKMKRGHLRSSTNVLWILLKHFFLNCDMVWYDMISCPCKPHAATCSTVCEVLQVKKIHILPRRASGKAAKKHHQSSWNILTPFCVFISCHLDTNLVFFSCRQMLQTPPWWKPHLQMLQTGPQGTSVTMLFHVVWYCLVMLKRISLCNIMEPSFITWQNHALWQNQKPKLEAATPSRKLKESHGSDIDDVRWC